MTLKLEMGRERIRAILAADGGMTLYGAHLLPHAAVWLPAVLGTGIRMLEIAHDSLYLARNPPRVSVVSGGRYDSMRYSQTIPVTELAERIRQLRVALEDVFLNVVAPGTYNQPGAPRFTDDSAFALSQAGADGLHVHLSSLDELAEVVDVAHRNGLLVEAYVHRFTAESDPFSYMGIAAESPDDVRRAVASMESIGVDRIGLMFSADPKFYGREGTSDSLPDAVRERVRALTDAATVPTSVEGQVTPRSARELRELGVNVLTLGRVFDIAIENAIADVVRAFDIRRPSTTAPA
ncbi:MAG: hypothetical protein FJW23_16935 [Acidimicrobiia bacterium]|nr:hypothetical protein [Acidimicrobiia bacterium]